MEIRKLKIHNIASIEDTVIDFTAEPLANSEVFLSTGNTGAGKSTILDAITLALYGITPRLGKKNKGNKVIEGNEEISFKDVRLLLRRGTGEGYTELEFIGSNNVPYRAKWSVHRKNNKPDGKFQPVDWELTNLNTGIMMTTNIDEEIKLAIGLKFNQFCRTTMLAQGEFTKFLNSENSDKSEILEKITGTEIYSKIGDRIFEKYKEAEKRFKNAQEKVEDVKLLSEEELQTLTDEKNQLNTEIAQLEASKKKYDEKKTWLEQEEELAKKLSDAENGLTKVEEQLQSETYLNDKQTVEQWNATTDARNDYKQKVENEKKIETCNKDIEEAARRLTECKAGEKWLENKKKELQERITKLEDALTEEASNKDLYLQKKSVTDNLNQRLNKSSQLTNKEEDISKKTRRISEELKPTLDTYQQQVRQTKENEENSQKAYDDLQTQLAQINMSYLRAKENIAKETLTLIHDAQEALHQLDQNKKRHDKDVEGQKEREEELTKKEAQLPTLTEEYEKSKSAFETAQKIYKAQFESTRTYAKKIRGTLQAGDICPVCRQKIASINHNEEEIDELVALAKQEMDTREKEMNEAKDKVDQLQAGINTDKEEIKKNAEKIANDQQLKEAESDAKVKCNKCNILIINEQSVLELAKQEKEQTEILTSTKAQITEGEKVEVQRDGALKKLESDRKKTKEAEDKAQKAQEAITKCQSAIDTAKAEVIILMEDIQKAEEELRTLTFGSDIGVSWENQPREYLETLQKRAKAYEKNEAEFKETGIKLDKCKQDLENVEKALQPLYELKPEWRTIEALEAEEVSELVKTINSLNSKVSSTMSLYSGAIHAVKEKDESLSAFLEAHPAISMELVKTLYEAYNQSKIDTLAFNVKTIEDDAKEKANTVKVYKDEYEKHQNKKPVDLEDSDTKESLGNKTAELKNSVDGKNQRIGEIKKEIDNDEKNKKDQETMLKEVERLLAIKERWNVLNDLIGTAEGKRFREIAQSYVLGALVNSANHYMRTLTDRYSMSVEPGTFIIMVIDAYQGYVRRPATTISGGESFLVSLSLALAMSDISQNLAVDTLFIDEGFGSLSGEPLQNAITTLRMLHKAGGRHVGIISHVEELREKIPVQIRVDQDAKSSSSKVIVVTV